MKQWLLFLLFSIFVINTWGQQKDSTNNQALFRGFQLRQSFQTADVQQSPAQLQLTLPGNGKDSWLVNAGLSAGIAPLTSSDVTSKLVAEYHRNTILTSPQNNYQIGYNLQYLQNGDTNLRLLLTGNIKYIQNVIDSTHSLAVTLNLAGYRNGKNGLDWDHPGYLSDGKYTYQFSPYFEAQYQQFFAGGKQSAGSVLRPLADLSGSFAINKPKTKKIVAPTKQFELTVDYTNRYAIVNTTNNREEFTKLFKAGLNYYFLNTGSKSISFGANYNQGSDPLNGLKDQKFWQFCLQIQL
jgi:hypothetical protein